MRGARKRRREVRVRMGLFMVAMGNECYKGFSGIAEVVGGER